VPTRITALGCEEAITCRGRVKLVKRKRFLLLRVRDRAER
jgi:hypothetical protein